MKTLQDECSHWAEAKVTCMTDSECFHPLAAQGGILDGDLKGKVEPTSTRVSNTTIKPTGPNSPRSVLTK